MTTATITTTTPSAPPCGRCGTTRGHVPKHGAMPFRMSGRRFNFFAKICHGCYYTLLRRERRGSQLPIVRPMASESKPKSPPSPCDLCEQPGSAGCASGKPFSIEGKVCRDCFVELKDEARRRKAARRVARRAVDVTAREGVLLTPEFVAEVNDRIARLRIHLDHILIPPILNRHVGVADYSPWLFARVWGDPTAAELAAITAEGRT